MAPSSTSNANPRKTIVSQSGLNETATQKSGLLAATSNMGAS